MLLVLVGRNPEDDLTGVDHIELGTCNALKVGIVFTHFFLRSYLSELI